MSEDKKLPTLEELREQFRKARPDLKLPPARIETPEEQKARKEEEYRRNELQRKAESLKQTAIEKPNTILRLIKKFTEK